MEGLRGDLHYQFKSSAIASAYEFYNCLRIADASKAAYILIELPPDTLEWKALRDKIRKLSQPENVQLFSLKKACLDSYLLDQKN